MSEEIGSDLRMTAGVCFVPKECEGDENLLGQDAYFICSDERTIGVADGVGGCDEDSGIYARQLMSNASESVKSQYSIEGDVDPISVLNNAFENSKAGGASTACIIALRGSCFLHAVNVGDSGFLVIRSGKIVYSSPVKQHYFNCPFQLGVDPRVCDAPSDADELMFKVQQGDTIVAATDGLYDNVFPAEIESLVTASLECGASPDTTALVLAKMALEASLGNEVSPFTVAACKAGLDRDEYLGGKYDDVTILVAYIQ